MLADITSSAPSKPPTNIKYQLVDDVTLTFTWDMPECGSRRGEITKYEYAFGLDGGHISDGWTTPENRVAYFDSLDYFKDYIFQVRADTAGGSGPFSDLIKVRTRESSKYTAVPLQNNPTDIAPLCIFHNTIPWVDFTKPYDAYYLVNPL